LRQNDLVAVAAVAWCVAVGAVALVLTGVGTARAQQLEPRAYAPAPRGLNFIGLAPQYSFGGVVTDPSLPFENVRAEVYTLSPYYDRTFGLLGRLASLIVATPYGWGHVRGDVQDVGRSADRTGWLDPQLRLGVNLLGCPALTPQEFAHRKPGATFGASVSISAPFGQYDSSKLINLGTNRWAYKPELGLSQPFGDWVIEFYAGVSLFQTNRNFYGGQVREQDPLASYQTHAVYLFHRGAWAAADFTYYNGGATTVIGQPKSDRQDNARGGLTLSFPYGKHQSLKLAWAQGVSTRVGSSFQTVGVGWQWRWL